MSNDRLVTSPLRQTCVGCGWEIGGSTPFVRDPREEPWHQQCKTIADKWLAEAVEESAQLRAEIAKLKAELVDACKPQRQTLRWSGLTLLQESRTTITIRIAEVLKTENGYRVCWQGRLLMEGRHSTESEAKAATIAGLNGEGTP